MQQMKQPSNEVSPSSKSSSSSPPPKDINILLIGESGVGKTTTLCAVESFLKYSSFDDARKAENFRPLVPLQISIPCHPETGKESVLKTTDYPAFNNNQNHNHSEHSDLDSFSTKSPTAYVFYCDSYRIRLIDTPGIEDTRICDTIISGQNDDNYDRWVFGNKRNEINFEKIFILLQSYDHLNAILFIVNSVDNRQTAFYSYCITTLFAHLHHDVHRIIYFCFTHSATQNYGLGEGFTTLRAFFSKEMAHLSFNLVDGVNCFSIDNDSFRYLITSRMGVQYLPFQLEAFRHSWNHSSGQIVQLLGQILAHVDEPHLLNQTVSLNIVRQIVIKLVPPMIKMQNNINYNIVSLRQQKEKLKAEHNEYKEELSRSLNVEMWELKSRKLKYPSTVCSSSKCTKNNNYDIDGKQYIENVPCHENCHCPFVTDYTFGKHFIKFCNIMNWNIKNRQISCYKCGCSWREHIHINQLYFKEKVTLVNRFAKKEIDESDANISQLDQELAELDQMEQEYCQELATLQEIAAKFDFILKKYSYFVSFVLNRKCIYKYIYNIHLYITYI